MLIATKQISTLVPAQTQEIYVSAGGSDTLNDGSILRPYATVSKAMASPVITGASPVLIEVGEGTYPEAVALKPNVYVKGSGPNQTLFTGAWTADPTWAANPGAVSGVIDAQFGGATAVTFDFLAITAPSANVTFSDVIFGTEGLVVNSDDNASTLTLSNCRFNGPLSLQGLNSRLLETSFRGAGASITVLSASNTNFVVFEAIGGGTDSTVNFSSLVNGLLTAKLIGFAIAGLVTLTGPNNTVVATSESISTSTGFAFAGGSSLANVFYYSFAPGLGYDPTVPANWSTIPVNVQQALDELAASSTGAGSKPVNSNKGIAALTTVANNDPAVATGLAATSKGYVAVLVNGSDQLVGDSVKTLNCYWAVDANPASPALPNTNVPAGSILHWVGSSAGFQLAPTDLISYDYNT